MAIIGMLIGTGESDFLDSPSLMADKKMSNNGNGDESWSVPWTDLPALGPLQRSRAHRGEPIKAYIDFTQYLQVSSDQQSKSSHSNSDRDYLCPQPGCRKSFTDRSKLKRHQLVHTVRLTQGERPYECSYCGKRFSLDFNLKTHFRTHSGEKPYICERCGKCFTQSSNLTSHMKIHQSEGRRSSQQDLYA